MQESLLPCLTYYGHGDSQAGLDMTSYKKSNRNKEGHKPNWFPFTVIFKSWKLGSIPLIHICSSFLQNFTSTLGKISEKGGSQRLEENAESPGKWEINTHAFVFTESVQWNTTVQSTAREPRESTANKTLQQSAGKCTGDGDFWFSKKLCLFLFEYKCPLWSQRTLQAWYPP